MNWTFLLFLSWRDSTFIWAELFVKSTFSHRRKPSFGKKSRISLLCYFFTYNRQKVKKKTKNKKWRRKKKTKKNVWPGYKNKYLNSAVRRSSFLCLKPFSFISFRSLPNFLCSFCRNLILHPCVVLLGAIVSIGGFWWRAGNCNNREKGNENYRKKSFTCF